MDFQGGGKRPPRRRLIFHRWLGSALDSRRKHHRESCFFFSQTREIGTLIEEQLDGKFLVLIHRALLKSRVGEARFVLSSLKKDCREVEKLFFFLIHSKQFKAALFTSDLNFKSSYLFAATFFLRVVGHVWKRTHHIRASILAREFLSPSCSLDLAPEILFIPEDKKMSRGEDI